MPGFDCGESPLSLHIHIGGEREEEVMDIDKYKILLNPPIMRAAYSDRTAWLMAVMSNFAYIKFEEGAERRGELQGKLKEAGFVLINTFDHQNGTQAFLSKQDDGKLLVLAFRGTEKEDPRDIVTDLDAKFYKDDKGVKIHNGFYRAFQGVKDLIGNDLKDYGDHSLYITGHSLGGALALIATKMFNSDNLAACYTFGSPKVGNEEFDDDIKPPIYRIVNAYDLVPASPPTYLFDDPRSLLYYSP